MKQGHFALIAAFLAAAALLSVSAQAYVSSQEALNFVCTNAYLTQKECQQAQIEFNSRISLSQKQYWVITVFSGDSPSGFIAVEDNKAGAIVPGQQAINLSLFKTADTLRSLGIARQKFSDQKQWVFSNSNSQFFSDLARFLDNEKSDLGIIGSDANSAEISAKIDSMKQKISLLSLNSGALSASISEAISAESDYFLSPGAEGLAGLREKYDAVFPQTESLKREAIEYDSMVRELKALISTAGISSDQKSQFIALADAPQQLYQLTSFSSVASSNRQSIDSAFQNADSRALDLAQNLSLRLERVKAYAVIYKENKLLSSATNGTYTILKAAYDDIMKSEKKSLWNNQAKVSGLQGDYAKAVQSFDAGKYSDASGFAAKASDEVVSIYRDGISTQDTTQTETMPDLSRYALPAVGFLIVLIIVLFIFSNRKNIFGKKGEGNENENRM